MPEEQESPEQENADEEESIDDYFDEATEAIPEEKPKEEVIKEGEKDTSAEIVDDPDKKDEGGAASEKKDDDPKPEDSKPDDKPSEEKKGEKPEGEKKGEEDKPATAMEEAETRATALGGDKKREDMTDEEKLAEARQLVADADKPPEEKKDPPVEKAEVKDEKPAEEKPAEVIPLTVELIIASASEDRKAELRSFATDLPDATEFMVQAVNTLQGQFPKPEAQKDIMPELEERFQTMTDTLAEVSDVAKAQSMMLDVLAEHPDALQIMNSEGFLEFEEKNPQIKALMQSVGEDRVQDGITAISAYKEVRDAAAEAAKGGKDDTDKVDREDKLQGHSAAGGKKASQTFKKPGEGEDKEGDSAADHWDEAVAEAEEKKKKK